MTHLDIATLVSFVRGETSPEVEEHLRSCSKCRDLAAVAGLELEVQPTETGPREEMYTDLELYGKGGMGEVYLAQDRTLSRPVLIKKPPRGSDGLRYLKLAARLEHERTVLAQLNHPAIPPVFAGGHLGRDREPYFAMPIAGEETLTAAIARHETLEGRITLLPSVISVAEGVAYAHARGVIHRDIKPDHVLLGSSGEARLIDWGLAKVLSEDDATEALSVDASAAQRGQLLATVQGLYTEGYSPPEQREDAPAEKHFDVYALGATLFFVLTGRHPGHPHPRRSEFPPGCPHTLVRIIRRAMHYDPRERYRDGSELRDVLKTFQAGRLVHPNTREVIADWVRRRALGLLAAGTIAGAFGAAWLTSEHRAELEATQMGYRGQLEGVRADARAIASARQALEARHEYLQDGMRTLKRAATATVTRLREDLARTRQQVLAGQRREQELRGLAADYEQERTSVLAQWEQTRAELAATAARVKELRAELETSKAAARRSEARLLQKAQRERQRLGVEPSRAPPLRTSSEKTRPRRGFTETAQRLELDPSATTTSDLLRTMPQLNLGPGSSRPGR